MSYEFKNISLRGVDTKMPTIWYENQPVAPLSVYSQNEIGKEIRLDLITLLQTLIRLKINLVDANSIIEKSVFQVKEPVKEPVSNGEKPSQKELTLSIYSGMIAKGNSPSSENYKEAERIAELILRSL